MMGLLAHLLEIERTVDRIGQKVEILMPTLQNFKDITAAISAEIDRIEAKLAAGTSGLNDAEEAEALADAQALKDRLSGIGT